MGDVIETTKEDVSPVMGRLMADFAAASGTLLTAVGLRVGLWEALAAGRGSAAVVGARAGVAVPYAREWLRSQTAAGYVDYDAATGEFGLASGVDVVLAGPLRGLVEGTCAQLGVWWAALERYVEAFRTGGGVSWGDLQPAHAEGMDLITRTVVVPALVGAWLPVLDGVVAKLTAGAVVADVGCGYGAPTIAMAEAFPASRFVGFDLDDASVSHARKAAAVAGVGDRVSFEVLSATEVVGGPFDLVVFVDSLHDLGWPAAALARVREVLAVDGVVLLVEHAGSERLEENLNPAGRFFYACSALVCTPNALADHAGAVPLGTIPGAEVLRRVATDAGFSRVRQVKADAPFNLLLELRP
jgi:SAM-dependent methyltransferase